MKAKGWQRRRFAHAHTLTIFSNRAQVKASNKRLSIEGVKRASFTPQPQGYTPDSQAISSSTSQSPAQHAKTTQAEGAELVQHVDVTEEVNRRLQESRLRRLMQNPSTAQKRKYDAYEEAPRPEDPVGADEEGPKDSHSTGESEQTPTKRLRGSGVFEQMGSRSHEGPVRYDTERFDDRTDVKRRKFR